ncbi:hypothetical protein HBH98_085790 [Parastagonospora nodorum]|nr:hypothetical protein HBI10_112590 [Parastagonospora nodorum]KAH4014655.1 hypothetical protein HBI13_168920 [Parastagonospora nodorum]KAH4048914.1 hypothetical protein HBH49_152940 [Parastagonospora nodorum]KAH4066011.1 hypothetical protein HBH50_153850 [Parastagonospora nodorum]KAH4087732.1 hypothetical protein HBH48_136540 [Parastagonospora nodorum]
MLDQINPRPLEDRLVALLLVFQEPPTDGHDHDECEEGDCDRLTSQALNILAQDLAFLIRNKDDAYGRAIHPEDIFVTMLSWDSYLKGMDDGTLAVMVRTAKTTKLLQVRVEPKEKVLEKLVKEVDKMLLKAMLLV